MDSTVNALKNSEFIDLQILCFLIGVYDLTIIALNDGLPMPTYVNVHVYTVHCWVRIYQLALLNFIRVRNNL
jgi:hypothetical protein